jgi:hypothetical protein
VKLDAAGNAPGADEMIGADEQDCSWEVGKTMWESLLRRSKAKQSPQRRPATRSRVDEEFGPPITPYEQRANLSDLERKLNEEMLCQAGKNQVFIRSLLTGTGTTQPRIMLKCPLRRDIDLKPDVFYEHIRDVCCTDPEQCEAYRHFKERFVET